MATIKEQEELVEVLKFTPRTYRIELGAYGGEVYAGRVDRATYEYFKENNIDIEEYANSWDDNELEVPEEFQPFPPGSPYDCDGLVHASGATMDDGNFLTVYDENNNLVYETTLDLATLEKEGIEVNEWESFFIDDLEEGEVIFWGAQGDKGLCYGGEIELNQPFNPKLIKLNYSNADGWLICNGVEYNGDDIDNNDLSTTGKWGENKWIIGGDEEVFDPSEQWDEPEIGPSPNDWESTPKFKFKKHKPVYPGYYRANWSYGSTFGSLYWDGENFGDWEYGKFNPVDQKGIVTWQGYNWDTSSWVNQPPEPVDTECPKCKWVGRREELIDNPDGSDKCPGCGTEDWEWIDYDPDTTKGRKNREKYCKEWDPQESLERIIKAFPNVEEDDNTDIDDEPPQPDCECVQCEWRGTVDETSYDDDDNMICPECGETAELIDYGTTSWDWKAKDTVPDAPGEYDVLLDLEWPHGGPGRATWDGNTWKRGILTVKINGWK